MYRIVMITVLAASVHVVGAGAAMGQREPHTNLVKYAGFSAEDLRSLEQGEVVTKVLDTHVDNEVAIMGAVWINANVEDFVARQKDIESFEGGEAVEAIQKLSRPPRAEDFAKLRFPEEDLDDLANCELGDCEVKIDEDSLVRLERDVDWSAPDAHARANAVIRQLMLEGTTSYVEGGVRSLAVYRDKKRPTFIAQEFEGMIENSPYITDLDPGFLAYLDSFPDAELPVGGDEYLYWSRVKFGLKSTIRLSHVVIFPIGDGRRSQYLIGSKLLYASHYFHTGLELKYLVRDSARPDADGFYLVSVNRSRSDGLTGLFGGLVRRRAVSDAVQGLDSALDNVKRMFESTRS